jgi:hypothetical protein
LSVRNQNSFGCGYPAGQSANPLDGAPTHLRQNQPERKSAAWA